MEAMGEAKAAQIPSKSFRQCIPKINRHPGLQKVRNNMDIREQIVIKYMSKSVSGKVRTSFLQNVECAETIVITEYNACRLGLTERENDQQMEETLVKVVLAEGEPSAVNKIQKSVP